MFAAEKPYCANKEELELILELVNKHYKVNWKEDIRKPFRMHHLTMESMLSNLNKILMSAHPPKIRKAFE